MKRALLAIDVQNEYFDGKLPVAYPDGSFANILKALDAAARYSIPAALIQHTAPQPGSPVFAKGSKAWELHPEILRRKHELVIEKTLPGAFTGTELEKWLRETGAETVTIAGYMTQMCCDTTARQAMHLGFGVEFLSDATGTLDIANYAGKITAKQLHEAILITQAMRFSKVLDAAAWIAGLGQ